ncbi:hypothetical protein [Bacillus ndiopicus]|uniref:hypothetical protein n=1 Tax=Bacillus ndiopicus TaxID=1347368 RepID=UPI0005A7BA1D|nr:hypothetical protein [Bacillus ndiopicus]
MKFKIAVVILIAFLIGVVAGLLLSTKNITSSKMNNLDTSNYELLVNRIKNEFNVEGYKEILGENGDIVVVPDIIDGQQDIFPEGLYYRNKKFVYKNSENGMIIILSISAAEEREGRFWNHSISYDSESYNSKTGMYKDTYNAIFPNSEASIYEFTGNGYSLLLVGISSNLDNVDVFTLNETAQFLQELAKYLN